MPGVKAARKRDVWLLLIGVFKLLKGVALLVVGFGLLRLLNRDVASTIEHWIELLRLDPGNRYIHRILVRVFNVTPKQLRELSVGTFLYAGIFLTEGVGLLAYRRWAEYMTLVSTGLFVPLEIYELARHFTWIRVALLAANILIVVYLVMKVRRR
jgi:uncharacterized membrane protein (DUF2068 family)